MNEWSDETKEALLKFSQRRVAEGIAHQAERDKVVGEDKVFRIPAYEQKTAWEWSAEHKKTCPMRFDSDGNPKEFPGGAAGGMTSWKFTPTGIGMAIEVFCACGASENITDYENW